MDGAFLESGPALALGWIDARIASLLSLVPAKRLCDPRANRSPAFGHTPIEIAEFPLRLVRKINLACPARENGACK